ncbi:LY6E protein, partial [Cochlearius cochlearius]|nr:LY6E protein [Cochlearius cochlearius]
SLTCFTCSDAPSDSYCQDKTECSDNEKYCLTTYSTRGLGKCNDRYQRINKGCSALCPAIDLSIGIAGVSTSCCETHLCNNSGVSSVKTSYTMMALGVLASLACILRLGF